LFFQVLWDDKRNEKELGKKDKDIDMECFWSTNEKNKYPCFDRHDGKSTDIKKVLCEIHEFGESFFSKTANVYFGIYSRSGVYIKLACSYRLNTCSKDKVHLSPSKEKYSPPRLSNHELFRELLSTDNKKTEFSKKINEISSNIMGERGLYKKCIKEINNLE